jgi:hypothetical protein
MLCRVRAYIVIHAARNIQLAIPVLLDMVIYETSVELSTFHTKSTVALTSAETKEYDASYPVTALTIPLLEYSPEYYTPKRGNSICPQNQDRIPCMATTLANTRNNRVRNVKRVCGIPQLHRRNDRPTPPDMSVAETTKELTDAV